MGITARGAWVAVRRHFAELGVDVDDEPVTVVGIGDMSGDVFGNGMLRSRTLRLVGAFDHRHVFLDPDPDPEVSYRERTRLAGLPRSSWADYDPALISTGGGVFPRTAKSVRLSPQVRARLGIDAAELPPSEVIRALLRAPVDLLWNGGIGTYVKASTESHAEAGDRAAEAVRVDADELACRVIGEGGNLGLTQRARIEFAHRGGLCNTDFIDNAAGVDTSDREVNLKILLDGAVADGEIDRDERDALLRSLTDEVAAAVLADTSRQVRAISMSAARSPFLLDRHARLIRNLEEQAGLNRAVEHLPTEADLERRRQSGQGLTRPELAVLLAYSKNLVRAELQAADLPDDPTPVVSAYFPRAVQERFGARIRRHPLLREIAATQLASDLIDRAGPGFLYRLEERTGAGTPEVARAFAAVQAVFDLPWSAADGLPPAAEQAVLRDLQELTEHAAEELLHRGATGAAAARYRAPSRAAQSCSPPASPVTWPTASPCSPRSRPRWSWRTWRSTWGNRSPPSPAITSRWRTPSTCPGCSRSSRRSPPTRTGCRRRRRRCARRSRSTGRGSCAPRPPVSHRRLRGSGPSWRNSGRSGPSTSRC